MSNTVEIANAYIALSVKAPGVQNEITKVFAPGAAEADKQGQKAGAAWSASMKKALLVGGAAVAAGTVAAFKGLYEVGSIFDDVSDTIRTGTGATGDALKGLEKVAKSVGTSVPADFSKIGTVVADLNTRTGLSGKTLEKVSKQYLEAGRILGQDVDINTTTAAFNAFNIKGADVAKGMDSLFRVSQATGLGMNELAKSVQTAAPAMKNLGFSFEDTAALAGSLDKAGLNTQQVLMSMSKGMVTLAKDGEEPQAAFRRVTEELQTFVKNGDTAAALDLAGKVFGTRGASQFVGALQSGTLNMKDLMGATGATTDTILGVGEETADFAERVKVLGNTALVALEPLGSAVFNALGNAAKAVTPMVAKLGEFIAGVNLGDVVKLASNFTPLGIVFQSLKPVLPQVAKAFGDMGKILMDTGRQILPALLPAAQALVGVLSEVFKVVVPIVQQLVTALAPILKAIAPLFSTVLNAVMPLVQVLTGALTPILRVIGPILSAVLTPALWLLTKAIEVAGAVIGWLVKSSLTFLTNAFKQLGGIVTWLWNGVVGAFNGIGAAAGWLWSNAIKPAVDWISGALRTLGGVFQWLNVNVVQPVWKGIQSALQAGWSWIDSNVFTPFKRGIDLLAKGFEVAKAAIGKTWDGIKRAAAVPINFVLDTVWNRGLRSFWNDLVTNLGMKDMKLAKAPLVKFASGGVLPGYTPGRDVHEFYSPTGGRLALSGGEAIMRPEFTRLVGGKAGVDALNAAARGGRLGFANGGVWGELGNFAGDVWDNIASVASVAGDFLTDPLKAIQKHVIDGIIRPLLGGQNIFGRAVGQLPINLVKQLAKSFNPPSRGTSGMGWRAMQDIVLKNIPGARISSAYRSPGANASVGGAKGSYHMQGRAIDIVPPSMAMFNSIKRLFPNATELIYTPAGGAQLRNGRPFAGWSDKVRQQHYSHVHLAMANGGVIPRLFDNGGILPHGGMGVNLSGRPERVLNPDQTRAFDQGMWGPRELVVVDADGAFIGRMRVEAAGAVKAAFAPSSAEAVRSEFGQ